MCDDTGYEIEWHLKCDICGETPAVNVEDENLCEPCGIELYGKEIVSEWAGTEAYLQKHPEERHIWR